MRTALPQHTNIGNRTEQNKRTRNRASKRIRTNQSNARHVPPFLKCIHDRRMRCAMCDGGYPSNQAPLCRGRGRHTHTLSPLPLTVSAIVVVVSSLLALLLLTRSAVLCVWCFAPLLFSASLPPSLFFQILCGTPKIRVRPATGAGHPNDERLHRCIGSTRTDDGSSLRYISAPGFAACPIHPELIISIRSKAREIR